MSYPGQKHTPSLFSINQVSSNYPHDLDSDFGKHDEAFEDNFVQGLSCAKKCPEEDVGLRVDSHKRRSFAHRALYRSETKVLAQPDQGYGSEEDCYTESGEFEHCYSHESSLNFSSFGQFPDLPVLMPTASNQCSVVQEMSNEYVSEDEFDSSEDRDECDMFFSCADWETMKNTAQNPEAVCDTDLCFLTPSQPKRLVKLMDKKGCATEVPNDVSKFGQFDVDLVMKKTCTSTGKLLVKRTKPFGKAKTVSPKKFLRVQTHNLEPKESTAADHRESAFQDLCLSPMGLSEAFVDGSKVQSK